MGSAVALVRLRDKCVTETEAINMLTGAKTSVIGARGIMGAEGSTTFVIEGKSSQVKKAWGIVHGVRGADVSGARESLIECNPKSPMCAKYLSVGNMRIPCHSACVYQQPELVTEVFRIPTSINKVIKVAQL